MARQRFAPDHSLTAAARYIPPSDSAWDHERCGREYDELRKDWDGEGVDPVADPERGHIVIRYLAGFTRFDLDAGGIKEYIDFEKKPEMWKFRRLTTEQIAEIEHLYAIGMRPESNRLAFIRGVAGLENPANDRGRELAKLLENGAKPGKQEVWEKKVMAAIGDYSFDCLPDLAQAVRQLNSDLRPHEKKPSAEQPGAT